MRKTLILMALIACLYTKANAQHLKQDGTPDRRFRENKIESFNNSPTFGYHNPSTTIQGGYIKSNGKYVAPSLKTLPNNTRLDNFSTKGNYNPYSRKYGSKPAY